MTENERKNFYFVNFNDNYKNGFLRNDSFDSFDSETHIILITKHGGR